MLTALKDLKKTAAIGFVGGSDMDKQQEQLRGEGYVLKTSIRKALIEKLEATFPQYNLKYSIGGQISIDIFPKGWDKTFCLKHLEKEGFKEIHFFGDKTSQVYTKPMLIQSVGRQRLRDLPPSLRYWTRRSFAATYHPTDQRATAIKFQTCVQNRATCC
ncbi:hypothetical protein DI09_2p210 [Mitosporidium daphniae]|uniref:Phosphomannomutase n=1 Tax=Mitosporidium daphniae TaxID=1485682 RepID=A0A098VS45_9MICR|nr:uncharacterized protein DI09_2p210 [Mitosporidium daphniae]KGG51644.1 hypothetical protein DI09_2p210 [Mitosporidium daphniae]|eukprot:XP_013238071.1 uncharacterized protein DI09_2p210 [Mitosporidium daphniae]